LSGADAELLLIGTNDTSIRIDPVRIADTLAREPADHDDLKSVDLGTPRELVGRFVGAPGTLDSATGTAAPVTDGWPVQESRVQSWLTAVRNGIPSQLFDLNQIAAWCP